MRRADSSVEHIIPKSDGGTNERYNLALSHQKCNGERGGKRLTEVQLDRLYEWYGNSKAIY